MSSQIMNWSDVAEVEERSESEFPEHPLWDLAMLTTLGLNPNTDTYSYSIIVLHPSYDFGSFSWHMAKMILG